MPKDFVRTNIGINFEAFKLDEQVLFDHAVTVSNLRKQFRDKAEVAAREIELQLNYSPEQLSEAIKKINNRSATRKPKENKMNIDLYREVPTLRQ